MNIPELFLNSKSNMSLYIGGAGKGGSYLGLMKFKNHMFDNCKCAVVVRNIKDVMVCGGLFEQACDIFKDDIVKEFKTTKEIVLKNGSKISFIQSDKVHGRQYDFLFMDNASQIDETEDFNKVLRTSKQSWINTSSMKDRGWIFKMIKEHLYEFDEYYVFKKKFYIDNDVSVFFATCFDNTDFILNNPSYIKNLLALPIKQRNKLLYGYIYKSTKEKK